MGGMTGWTDRLRRCLPARALVVTLAAAVSLLGVAAATFGWLTAHPVQKVNAFSPGIVNVSVVEKTAGGAETSSGLSGLPLSRDGTADKEVWILNDNTAGNAAPAFIRVRLVAVWRNADGTGSGIPADGQVGYNLAGSSGWVYKAPYYYYLPAVAPGARTDQLLSGVTVKAAAGETLPVGKTLEIDVLADAVQAAGSFTNTAWGVLSANGRLQLS